MVGLGILVAGGGIAAASSFPSGFGFGAGYGAGVRAGYDIVYPRIAPYVKEIVDFLIPSGQDYNLSGAGISGEVAEASTPQSRFKGRTSVAAQSITSSLPQGAPRARKAAGVGKVVTDSRDQQELKSKIDEARTSFESYTTKVVAMKGRKDTGPKYRNYLYLLDSSKRDALRLSKEYEQDYGEWY